MRAIWAVISILIFLALLYLGFQALVSIGWVVGWAIVAIVVFLIIAEVITSAVGFGTVVTIIVLLIIGELFLW